MVQIDYAIDIVNLSKRFRRRTVGKAGYSTLKSALLNLFRPALAATQVHHTTVLEDLTLRIPRGASVGVIGRNGAGKSTFLKLLTGIYKADRGSVRVNGRLAALIELGAGFHPDFSGRENVYLGGIMHGLSRKEIEARFDEIVSFAELEEVIDDPVRTYSSGMFMRLGFSLAIHTRPDVLLVDEVLAVGDAAFVAKCKEQIARFRREGRTLIIVSHDLDAIERWCDEVLWLDSGKVKDRGEPRRVIDHYRSFVERGEEAALFQEAHTQDSQGLSVDSVAPTTSERRNIITDNRNAPAVVTHEDGTLVTERWGSREIEITGVRLLDQSRIEHRLFHPESALIIEIDYLVSEPQLGVVFGIGLNRSDGLTVHGTNTTIEGIHVPPLGAHGTVQYSCARLGLLDGTYYLDVAVHRDDGYPFDYHKRVAHFAVRSSQQQVGVCVPEHSWEVTVGA